MGDRRVPWAEGQRALVRWAANEDAKAGDWFEAVARMHEDGHVEGPVTDADRCRTWFSEYLDIFALDDDADSRPAPDHCGTCFEPFGCGCPGDGWGVPVHTVAPVVTEGVALYRLMGGGLHRYSGIIEGVWDCGMAPGEPLPHPVIPFRNGAPIYLKPWGQP